MQLHTRTILTFTALGLSLVACGGKDTAGRDGNGTGVDGNGSTTGQGGNTSDSGGAGNTGSGSTSSAGGANNTFKRPSGIYSTNLSPLPANEPTACEAAWVIRNLHYHPGQVVPRRMYFDACGTDTATPTVFASLALGEKTDGIAPTTGAIIEATLDPGSGELVPNGVAKQFPECVFMEGIAVSEDCSTVAALCRRKFGDKDYDMDSLATHADWDWMTEEACADHEMWLYEWTNGDITSEPKKYVLHRALGNGWEYANNYLVMGDDGTYGMGIKARVYGGDSCHEADAFLVMNRADHTFTNRGWPWACGTGHTLFNKPAYNPATQQYSLLCGTDYNEAGTAYQSALIFRQESGSALEFQHVNYDGLRIKGGVGSPVPLDDGGFLGAIVAVQGSIKSEPYPLDPPTSIGLARFDSAGALVGDIKWVAKDETKYLSYPQLAPLGNGRFLLGWAEMYDTADQENMNDDAYRIPLAYYVKEIDEAGTALTEPMLVDGVGWGEQDRMVPLGGGSVGWAYIPSPTLSLDDLWNPPSCNSDTLSFSVYTSAN